MKFFRAAGRAGGEAFGDQEAVGGDGQRRMMVKPAPAPTLVVAETELLLQVLVVALDAPAHVCLGNEIVDRGVGVANRTALGTPALCRRAASSAHSFGRYSR